MSSVLNHIGQPIGNVWIDITEAERLAGVTPTSYQYQEGYVDRYGVNASPATTDMTAAIQAVASVINAKGSGEIVFSGEDYSAWTSASTTLLALSATNGVTIRGNGSRIISRLTNGAYSWLIQLTGCSGTTIEDLRMVGGNTTLTASTGETFVRLLTGTTDTVIKNCKASNGWAFVAAGTGSAVPSTRSSGVEIINGYAEGVYYGIATSGDGDDLRATLRTVNCGRSYIAWNVKDHDVRIHSAHGGPFDDVLLKVYCSTLFATNRLENIKLNYESQARYASGSNQGADQAAISFDVQQFAATNQTVGFLSNIDITFDVAGAASPTHRRVLTIRRFNHDGSVDTSNRGHAFINWRITGRVASGQHFTEDILTLFQTTYGTWTSDFVFNFALENVYIDGVGAAGNGLRINCQPFSGSFSALRLSNVGMDIDLELVNQNDNAMYEFQNVIAANYSQRQTSTNIADAAAPVNAENKFVGRMVWDTNNLRMLRASGSGATDDWEVIDGSAQVTPA